MIILNITFVADLSRNADFIPWLLETQNQFIEKTSGIEVYRVATQNSDEAESFSFQVFFDNVDDFEVFRNINFLKIVNSCQRQFAQDVLYFDTILESL